jgi:fatty-acyl-CoA synthase
MQEADDVARAHAVAQDVRKAVQEGMGLTVDDVVPVVPGALPKTSSGKLQRAKTRELYEAGELLGRAGKGDGSKVDLMKSAALSQLSYLKLAVLGGRKSTPPKKS